MSETLQLRGTLRGHNGWVTQIATNPKYPEMILSCSRDKTLIVWKLTRDETNYGVPQKRLHGHSHFVSDVVLSSDGNYALSGSWDKTLRLWDLAAGKTTRRFEDHTKDVLSVAFSVDNRQIVSGSRDKTIKLWNTLAECKYTIQDDGHSDWVSCVRFSPNHSNPIIVSAGWDKVVKVWNLANCRLKINHIGHTGYLNTVTVSPDGSLCASGGKDCKAMLWDLNDGKHLHTLDHNDIITALCFSPNRYWLCAAFGPSIKIWDLESKDMVEELRPEVVSTSTSKAEPPQCLSLAWSTDGQTLFAGYSDNMIRVWQVSAHLMMVVDLILNLLTQHPINSVEFESRLSPHIGANTHHFLHEFYAFARSPYDMVGFDQSADYQHRPSFATEVQAIDSDSSDSDMIVLSPSVNNSVPLFPPRPPTPGPNAAEPFPVIQGLNDIQPLNLSASSSRPHQRLSPIAGPSSVVDEDFILMITRELQNPTYSHLDRVNTVRSYPPLPGSSREIPCQTVDSDSDDCVIVGYVKPRHERTPEIITLNSDVETADEVERGSESVDDSLKFLLSSSSSSSVSKTSDTSDSEYVPHPPTYKKKVTPKRKKPRKPHSSSDEGDSAEVRRRRIPSSDSDSESESAKHKRSKSKGKRKRIVSPRESSDDSKIDRIRSKNRKSRKEVWRIVRKQEPETDHDYSLDCYDPPYTEDEWASLSSDRPKLRSIVITKSAGSSGQREASYSSVASSSRSSSHYHDCKHHRHKSHKRDIRKRKDKRRSESSSPVRLTKGKKSKRKRSYRNDDSSS